MELADFEQLAADAGSEMDEVEQRRLLTYLLELGASEEELRAAIETLNVGGLALDLTLRGSRPTVTFDEAAEAAGLSVDVAAGYWRALGFPDPLRVPQRLGQEASGTLELLARARELLGDEASTSLARVIGTAMSRVSQAIVDSLRVQIEAPQLAAGESYTDIVKGYTELARTMIPPLIEALGAVMSRHLVAVASGDWAADIEGTATQDLVVGFADVTAFTALSRTLTPRELTRLVSAFEAAVTEATSSHGGRIVKLIGDGVLFSADDAVRACRIAADIVTIARTARDVPAVRVGLAAGPVVTLGGDLFGPVVNLAARLVAAAPDGSVTVDGEVQRRVQGQLAFEPLPEQNLKGVGAPTTAYCLVP